jgi:transcriptional regulator with AAA-type ATPase domain
MSERIFLSYANEDRELVHDVLEQLRKHHLVSSNNVVLLDPRESTAGADIRSLIKEQINSANKVVIIASDNSAKSAWVNYEAGMAAALDKPIVVLGRRGFGKTLIRALAGVQPIEIEAT